MPPRVGGHQHTVVGDRQQPVRGLHHDTLARQVAADVVAVLEDADPSGTIHASRDTVARRWFHRGWRVGVDDLAAGAGHELEAPGRSDVADRLVLAVGV